jgi:RNA polymerase sigma-70 factor (ECF subfamily)
MLWMVGWISAVGPAGAGSRPRGGQAAAPEAAPEAPDPSEAEDRAFVLQFQGGGEEGFNRLVLKHKDRVFSLCMRMLCDRDEADDTAQETFLRVFHGLKGFRLESRFSTWLHRIAVNACKNKLDSRAWKDSRAKAGLEAAEREEAGAAPSPAQVLEAKSRRARIEEAIARLPEDQRVLVVLRDVEGRAYEEIAESLALNPGTLKSRLNRARAQLQAWLKELR